jgi:hypothetical protein
MTLPPKNVSKYAKLTLESLAAHGLGDKLSLGGAILLDSFVDLIASKMVALVERGAPRDFRDIYEVCQAQLTAPMECWQWWEQRQLLSGSDADHYRARLAVETHLARIAQHRPLEHINEPSQRQAAQQVRRWFLTEFLDALSD